MDKAFAFVLFLLAGCSDAPDPVLAARPAEPSSLGTEELAVAVVQPEFVTGPGMPRFGEPLEYDSLTPAELRAPQDWSEGIEGVSPGIVALLAGLDQAKLAKLTWPGLDVGQRSTLYRVPAPRDTTLYLYLQRLYLYDAGCFVLFLEDPVSGAITEEPIRYCSTWSSYDPPKPRLTDLDGDGVQEIVTKDFFHNGTVLNLTVDYYWEVSPDLSLRRVLKLARMDEGIRVEGVGFGTTTRRLMRAPERNGVNSFLIEVAWEPIRGGAPEVLGGVELNYNWLSKDWRAGDAAFDELPRGFLEHLSPMSYYGNDI